MRFKDFLFLINDYSGGEDEEGDALKEKGAAEDNDAAAESELSSSSKAPGAKGK